MSVSGGFNGHRVNLFACEDVPANHPDFPPQMFDDSEFPIEIEGDPKYLIPMLESWVNCLKGAIAAYEKRENHVTPTPDAGPQREL